MTTNPEPFSTESDRKCPSCQAPLQAEAQRCPQCGANPEPLLLYPQMEKPDSDNLFPPPEPDGKDSNRTCPCCHQPVRNNAAFCISCGYDLTGISDHPDPDASINPAFVLSKEPVFNEAQLEQIAKPFRNLLNPREKRKTTRRSAVLIRLLSALAVVIAALSFLAWVWLEWIPFPDLKKQLNPWVDKILLPLTSTSQLPTDTIPTLILNDPATAQPISTKVISPAPLKPVLTEQTSPNPPPTPPASEWKVLWQEQFNQESTQRWIFRGQTPPTFSSEQEGLVLHGTPEKNSGLSSLQTFLVCYNTRVRFSAAFDQRVNTSLYFNWDAAALPSDSQEPTGSIQLRLNASLQEIIVLSQPEKGPIRKHSCQVQMPLPEGFNEFSIVMSPNSTGLFLEQTEICRIDASPYNIALPASLSFSGNGTIKNILLEQQ